MLKTALLDHIPEVILEKSLEGCEIPEGIQPLAQHHQIHGKDKSACVARSTPKDANLVMAFRQSLAAKHPVRWFAAFHVWEHDQAKLECNAVPIVLTKRKQLAPILIVHTSVEACAATFVYLAGFDAR
jgi:hypothetical protein